MGAQLADYVLVELIGSGAMGAVYRARHRDSGDEVAIKLLLTKPAFREIFNRRMEREARAASRIDHPNVVKMIELKRDPAGRTFLVMELLRGRTLAEILEQEGAMPPLRAGRIAREAALGLAAIHRSGIVHRDLKPANLMIIPTIEGEHVKIFDLGIVCMTDRAEPKLTQDGLMLGTPAYMAPEQVQCPTVGPAADLYALGVILYEMLSGQPPFVGGFKEVAAKQIAATADPLPDCGGLEELVSWLMEKNPARRPEDAYSVVAEIDRLLPGLERGMSDVCSPNAPTLIIEALSPIDEVAAIEETERAFLALTSGAQHLGPRRVPALSASPPSRSLAFAGAAGVPARPLDARPRSRSKRRGTSSYKRRPRSRRWRLFRWPLRIGTFTVASVLGAFAAQQFLPPYRAVPVVEANAMISAAPLEVEPAETSPPLTAAAALLDIPQAEAAGVAEGEDLTAALLAPGSRAAAVDPAAPLVGAGEGSSPSDERAVRRIGKGVRSKDRGAAQNRSARDRDSTRALRKPRGALRSGAHTPRAQPAEVAPPGAKDPAALAIAPGAGELPEEPEAAVARGRAQADLERVRDQLGRLSRLLDESQHTLVAEQLTIFEEKYLELSEAARPGLPRSVYRALAADAEQLERRLEVELLQARRRKT